MRDVLHRCVPILLVGALYACGAPVQQSQPEPRAPAASTGADAPPAPEGEVRTDAAARESDVYMGEVLMWFRRGWQPPESIPEAELQSLVAVASASFDGSGRLVEYSIEESSGNAAFDESVLARFRDLAGPLVPLPPGSPEATANIWGGTIALRIRGPKSQPEPLPPPPAPPEPR